MAQQRDRGVHEGLAFEFDKHDRYWQIIVDLEEGWVKIMGRDEFQETMKDAVQRN
jgi:hypothetical protein